MSKMSNIFFVISNPTREDASIFTVERKHQALAVMSKGYVNYKKVTFTTKEEHVPVVYH